MVMARTTVLFSICFLFFFQAGYSQKFSRRLLKADKLYIKKDYRDAVVYYEKYLHRHPGDFYASRQAARCYGKMDDQNMAIDYWPAVIENSEASESDQLDYARCLLANYRSEDARKVFVQLSRSSDKAIASWGKAYMDPARFYKDSALCKVTEISGINTAGHEYSPVIFDGKLFYLSDAYKNMHVFNARTDKRILGINTAPQTDSTHFQTPAAFMQPQAKNATGPFCFSADGSTLYLSVAVYSKDMGIKHVEPFYRFQLFTAPVSNPAAMQPFGYNSPDHDLMYPNISKDGKRLYFSSDMKGTLGGKDIFMCEWANGSWSAPVNLGPEINSVGNEVFPHVTEDGSLYFVSDTRPGLGGLDIFTAKPAAAGKLFEEAQNVGSPVNTQFDDFGIFLLPGGRTGYLSSNRKNNTDDDIFYFRNNKP